MVSWAGLTEKMLGREKKISAVNGVRTLNVAVACRSYEVCTFLSYAIPVPLEHLNNDIFIVNWIVSIIP
jgi:hypothetical protein